MRSTLGEAGPFGLSGRRRATGVPGGLVGVIPNSRPVPLVAGVHPASQHARVYLRRQAVVLGPRSYPIRSPFRPLNLAVNRNLHSRDQLAHANILSATKSSALPNYAALAGTKAANCRSSDLFTL